MERTYDIFEVLPDGKVEWLEYVSGHEAALERARELAAKSKNEFRVMHLPTNSIVAVLNRRESAPDCAAQGGGAQEGDTGEPESSLRARRNPALRRRIDSRRRRGSHGRRFQRRHPRRYLLEF